MKQDEASEYIAESLAKMVDRQIRFALQKIKTGEGTVKFPNGKSQEPHFEHLHAKLAAAGLLDDEQFCDALVKTLTWEARGPLWGIMLCHDGDAGIDDAPKIRVGLKDGPDCHNYMGEIVSQFYEDTKWADL